MRPDENEKKEKFIPLCEPLLKGNEWKYVKDCIDTGWVSSVGAYVDKFEKKVADYVGCKRAVAVSNGTAALHISLLVAGVGPGDEVIVPSLTFIAPVNVVRYIGAWPVFIDAEERYWQMDCQKLTEFVESGCSWRDGNLWNKKTGRRVKAIVPVHIMGHPVNMDSLMEAAKKYELAVVEDATESLGAKYKDRMLGSIGDIACFSFNGNKIITTGGGGMIVTNNEKWADRAKYLTTQAKDDAEEFVHNEIGYNYRLTNVLAAIGLAQMEVLDEYVSKKRKIALRYIEELSSVKGIEVFSESPYAHSTYWMSAVKVSKQLYGIGSRDLIAELKKNNIQARPLWHPVHLNKPYASIASCACPVSEKLCEEVVCIPSSVGLNDEEQARVIEVINKSNL